MDVGILLVRLTVGLPMAAHGAQKLFGWFGGYGPTVTGQFMEGLGFRPGRRHAMAAGLVEVTAGLLLAVGFLTPLAAAMIASVMVVAAATVHWKNGFFITTNGYEFNAVMGVVALSLAFSGPGRWSVDAVFGLAREGATWGMAALVVAVAGAIGQMAQRQVLTSPPVPIAATDAGHRAH